MMSNNNQSKKIQNKITNLLAKLSKSKDVDRQEVIELLSEIGKNYFSTNSDLHFYELFNNMQNAVAIYEAVDNGNDFVFVDFNPVAEKIENIKKEKLIGKKVTEVFPGVIKFGLLDVLKRVLETGISQNHPLSVYEDDRIKGWRENFVYKTTTGKIVAIYRDLTQQKIAEEKLTLSEQNLKLLINNQNEAIWSIDDEYNYIIFNDFYEDQYYKIHKIRLEKGINALDLLTREQYDFWKGKYDRALSGEKLTFEYKAKMGRQNHLYEVSLNPIISNNKVTGVAALNIDITEQRRNEEALKESEEKYKFITQSSLDIIFRISKTGKVLYLNESIEKILGYKSKEIIGKSFKSCVPKTEISKYLLKLKEVFQDKEVKNFTTKVFHKKGHIVDVEINGKIIEVNGKLVGQGSIRDITKRKKAEEEVRKREENYRGIFNASPDAIYIQDKNGVFLDVNASVEKMYGYNREHFIGKTPEFISAPGKNDIKAIAKAIKKAYNGEKQNFEFWAIKKNGEIFPTDVMLYPGKYCGKKVIIAVGRDITERKKAENEIREKERNFRLLFENSPLGTFVADPNGAIIDVNKALLKMLGSPSVEATKQVNILTHKPLIENGYVELFKKCVKENKTIPLEIIYTSKWGVERSYSSYLIPLSDGNGKVQKIYTIMEDITERKEAEKGLRESETIFRELAQSTSSAIFVYQESGFVFVNRTTEQLTGYSKEELLKMNFWDVVHPDFKDEIMQRGIDRQKGKKVPNRYRFKIVKKSGKEIWVDFTAGKINWKGKPAGLATAFDITDRILAEEKLRKSEERYRLVTSLTTDYLYSSAILEDGSIELEWVAGSFKKITGYSVEEYKKLGGWKGLLYPDDIEKDEAILKKIINNETTEVELRTIHKNGSIVWVRVLGYPIWNKEKERVTGVIGAVKNITEEKHQQLVREIEYNIAEAVVNVKNTTELVKFHKVVDAFL